MNLWKRIQTAIDDYIASWHEAAAQTRRTNAEIDILRRQAFGLDAAEKPELKVVENQSEVAETNGTGNRVKAKAKGGR